MKVPSFISGTDEQRSKNLSDNKLINLYPTTNNDGSIAAFYKVDGLKIEGTLSGVPTGAYKASNGRAFYTSGTTLYELTFPAGVYTSTSRGTITTATNYEFSDNGLEMIMVNGTDGWIFTFSTNALLKLTVLTGNFTVQAATAVDVDATLTKTAHGLIVGDRVILTTTGSLPTYLLPNTAYYVLADGFTVDAFKVGLTLTGATCTISNGTPCTITSASHNFIAGDKIRFLTTGALPASLAVGTVYYVLSAGITQDTFRISLTDGGTAINTTTAGSGVHSFNPAITIIQTAIGTCSISSTSAVGGSCTISYASPAVFTKTTHGLVGGEIIIIYPEPVPPGGGTTMPGGISAGINYYVLAAGLTVDTFRISLTDGGTAINTSSAGVDPHYYTVVPAGYVTTYIDNSLEVGDSVQFATTGALPTGLTINTEYFVTGYQNITFDFGYLSAPVWFSYIGKWIFTSGIRFYSTDPSVGGRAGQKLKFKTNGVLPTLLNEETEYQIQVTSTANYYMLTVDGVIVGSSGTQHDTEDIPITSGLGSGLHTYIFKNTFALVTTLPEIFGTRLAISGTQSGTHSYFQEGSVAYGTHTYTTGGSGFPNGAKTISYMNGRFIACDPNTQDFYVSEVLDGKTWDTINVQTVDSNPDYVTGQIVAHNELFVFCENSGETYYDSGTTPTPFVRNITGIFEVGCKAPYTIKEIGGAIIFLGNTNSGNGIVYRMQGLTPVRISTYSIEYQIQNMSDISDARAFTYQKDGHHFYVLTFPAGNKTFVFDASTSLWHERAEYNMVAIEIYSGSTSYSVAFDSTTDSIWSARSAGGVIKYNISDGSSTTYSTGSVSFGIAFDNVTSSIWVSNYGSNNISKVNISDGTKVDYATGIAPKGVVFDSLTESIWVVNSTDNTVSKISILDGTITATYPTGNSPAYIAFDSISQAVWVTNTFDNTVSKIDVLDGMTLTYATGINPHQIVFDPITLSLWVVNISENTVSKIDNFSGTKVDYATGLNPFGIAFDSISNAVWVTVNSGSMVLAKIDTSTGSRTDYTQGSAGYGMAFDSTTESIWVSRALNIAKININEGYFYREWPVNKYLYFNNEHLVTDDTTTLFSIDSSTYQNGTDPIRIVRSFRAPPSDMKRVAHHTIQVDCEVGIGTGTEPVIALRWSDDAGNTWSTPIERGLGLVGDHAKSVIFRRLGATKGLPRIYELSCDENVKITLLDCYLE